MTEQHTPTAPDTTPEPAEDTVDPSEPETASFVDGGVEDDDADGDAEAAGDAADAEQATADAPASEAAGTDSGATDAEDAGTSSAEGDSTADDVADVPGDEDYLPPGQTEVPVGDEVVIDDETMRRALEAILMVTDEPLPVLTLARAVGRPTGDVASALEALAEEYNEQGRGFDLREVGGGWRYYTRVEAAPYVERFVLDGQQARLTQAALETLAVVAYKQPVSRARVSAIRGVNVDGVMRTLVARGLVEEAGADTESQATLYRTTSYFLERMGMQSLDDLPELAPYLPDMDDIEDELAAQTLPPASPEESAPTEEPTDEAGEGDTGVDGDLSTDESREGDTGVDGDLSTDEPVELDVEHEPGELEPSEEVEPAGSTADEGELQPSEEGEAAGHRGTAEYSGFGDGRRDG
ncbi:SMC-Scp complex subunit ScpB [Kribbella sp. NPDC049174]|uniref:SMC-Scp complex subunit ScpB n=1 Tax=Kribbella sp. NPDC049174 TaxID=3364112 RepID=UPI003722DC41